MTDRDNQRHRAQLEFTGQAAAWATEPRSADLGWVVEACAPAPSDRVLDVGAGTGLVSRAFADRGAGVVAADLTAAMLIQAGAGVTPCQCAAEHLPFASAAFDVVVTRWLVHHVAEPDRVADELVRCTKPGGRIAVVDLVSPDEPARAARYNELERWRDPSHTRALDEGGLRALLTDRGAEVAATRAWDREVDLADWLAFRPVEPAVRDRIVAALRAELDGGAPTGMRPFERDGALGFRHAMRMVIARAPRRDHWRK